MNGSRPPLSGWACSSPRPSPTSGRRNPRLNSGYTAAPHDGTPKQASAKATGCRCRQGNDRRPSNQPDDKEQGAVHGLHPLIVKPPERLAVFRAGQGRELVHHHLRSEEHTSELQSLMRISYAVFCLKKTTKQPKQHEKYLQQNKSMQQKSQIHITK